MTGQNNVYMLPTPTQAAKDTSNAIHQIVLRLARELPAYGWQVVEQEAEADLVAGHAGQTDGQTWVDVAHCHGLYPTYEFPDREWHWAANAHVAKNLLMADYATAPSQWVGDILRRDFRMQPAVIGWAIDFEDWKPGHKGGYLLWNKTRADGVCDPAPALALAEAYPDLPLVTTFGEGGANVQTIGRQPYDTMKGYVREASLYLATTKETFGIGTLEAMAAGCAILGYDWGGTRDLIDSGTTGILVPPGDVQALIAALPEVVKNASRLGANAREAAREYHWPGVAAQFAQVYNAALARKQPAPKVTVVIPVYNYQGYVRDAILSVLAQEMTFDYEVIVVDDHSTDDSLQAAQQAAAEHEQGGRVRVIQTEANSGPAHARNTGIAAGTGRYVLCLDADDMLAVEDGGEHTLQTLAEALDHDYRLGMAYTEMKVLDGGYRVLREINPWPGRFDFSLQLKGQNQVPTCCLFRRKAWERAGGYRANLQPAEDADLWTRIGGLGYTGQLVIERPYFVYRWHEDSLSKRMKEPAWARLHEHKLLEPPVASALPTNRYSHPLHNYDQPEVSIIIPCGPGHTAWLPDALDTVEAQTFWNWECIVWTDGYEIPPEFEARYPWAKFMGASDRRGPGAARNWGAKLARGKHLVFLDADDLLHPHFLAETLHAFRLTGRYVYTDWLALGKDGRQELHRCPDYEQQAVFQQTSIHAVTVLIPRIDFEAIGGFREDMPAWEDVEFYMRLAVNGYCGHRLAKPLFTYRYSTGNLREHGETIKPDLKALLVEEYGRYMEGEPVGCGCGAGQRIEEPANEDQSDMVRVIYDGEAVAEAKHTVKGPVTRQSYGRRKRGEIFFVWEADAQGAPDIFHPAPQFEVKA